MLGALKQWQKKVQHQVMRTARGTRYWLMCLGIGKPPEKLDHSLFRKWLSKYTCINGCIPTPSGNFPKVNIQRLKDGM